MGQVFSYQPNQKQRHRRYSMRHLSQILRGYTIAQESQGKLKYTNGGLLLVNKYVLHNLHMVIRTWI